MQRNNTKNEPQRKNQHHNRIDLQPRRLIRIQSYPSSKVSNIPLTPHSPLYFLSPPLPPHIPTSLSSSLRSRPLSSLLSPPGKSRTHLTSYYYSLPRPPRAYCSASHSPPYQHDRQPLCAGSQSSGRQAASVRMGARCWNPRWRRSRRAGWRASLGVAMTAGWY